MSYRGRCLGRKWRTAKWSLRYHWVHGRWPGPSDTLKHLYPQDAIRRVIYVESPLLRMIPKRTSFMPPPKALNYTERAAANAKDYWADRPEMSGRRQRKRPYYTLDLGHADP